MLPAMSTASAAPPRSSLAIFWPSERSTTGGPAANTWLVPVTITDQCERMARPAGPPAAVPSTALTTGTLPISSTERSKPCTPGNTAWPRRLMEVTLPPDAVDQVDERNAVAGRQVLDEAALAALLAVARPAGAAAHREVLAADGDRTPVDGGEAHDVGCRRYADELAVDVASLAGEPADLLEGAGVDQPVDALANRQATLAVVLGDRLGTAELRRLGPPQTQLLDLRVPAAGSRRCFRLIVHAHAPLVRGRGLGFQDGHDLALGDGIALGDQDLAQRSRLLDDHRDLHLHRLEEQHRLAGFDAVCRPWSRSGRPIPVTSVLTWNFAIACSSPCASFRQVLVGQPRMRCCPTPPLMRKRCTSSMRIR